MDKGKESPGEYGHCPFSGVCLTPVPCPGMEGKNHRQQARGQAQQQSQKTSTKAVLTGNTELCEQQDQKGHGERNSPVYPRHFKQEFCFLEMIRNQQAGFTLFIQLNCFSGQVKRNDKRQEEYHRQ